MFTKLLKHDFKNSAKIMVPFSIAAIVSGLVCTGVVQVIISLTKSDNGYVTNLLLFPLFMLVGVSAIGIAAYVIICPILMYVRFYRSRFTDEGYLTFTLPASASNILLSSYTNTVIWTLISFITAFLAILGPCLVFFNATDWFPEDVTNVFFLFIWLISSSILPLFQQEYTSIIWIVFSTGIAFLGNIMLYHAVITLGCTIAKTHKVLICLVLLYLIHGAVNVVTQFLSFLLMLTQFGSSTPNTTIMLIPQAIIMTAVLIGGYFLSTYLMKNKLNL